MAPEKRQITRNRTSYSCQTCRRRKVKCDKRHPVCGTCEKNEEECVYPTDGDDAHTRTENAPETNRKRKLAPEHDVQVPHETDLDESNTTGEKLAKIRSLLDQASSLASEAGLTSDSSISTQSSPQSNATETLQSISARLDSLNLLFTSGQKSPHVLNGRASQPVREPRMAKDPDTRSFLNIPQQVPWEKEVSVKAMPDAQSNVLFRCWLVSMYSILPIVDPYAALDRYNTFHFWYRHDYDRGIPNPVAEFMPLIIAIQYGGLLGLSTRGARKWWPEVPRRVLLSNIRLHFWRIIDTTVPSVETVAAEVMMRYMCHERYTIAKSSAQLAILIRNAQGLGLHKHTTQARDQVAYQIQRRLWWEVVNLDTLLSSSCLVSPLLNDKLFNVKIPSELKDHRHGTEDAFRYEMSRQAQGSQRPAADYPFDDAKSSIVSPYGILSAARATWTTAMRKMVDILTGVETITQIHIAQMSELISEVTADLTAIVARFPTNNKPEMSDPPPPNPTGQSVAIDAGSVFGNPIDKKEIDFQLGAAVDFDESQMPFVHKIEVDTNSFYKWARIALSMMADQIVCFAFAPFLRDPDSTLWKEVRKCNIKCAQRFFRRYISLASSIELESFRWTWVGMFQPIHASKILLIDLHQRPFSEEAVQSRALFDQVLLLNYPDYGIVGGSYGLTFVGPFEDETQESWTLLNHLRSKAWQRAYLDPAYLWNEEDDQLKRIQQRTDLGFENLRCLTGEVRPDQPRAPQKSMDESEWRYVPEKDVAPFKGLDELINKIRGSKDTPPSRTKEADPERGIPSALHSYGDEILGQQQQGLSKRISVDVEEVRSDSSLLPSTSQPGYRISGRPGGSGGPLMTEKRPSQYHTANEGSDLADGLTSTSILSRDGGTFSGAGLRALPEFGHIFPHTLIPLPPERNGHLNHDVEFDWHRWDTVYGYPNSSDVHGLASPDVDRIEETLQDR